MKVLFLDFDGVINSIRSAVAFGGYPWNVGEESLKLFDPVGIALIQKVCKDTGCKIVLSSTWRKCFSYKELATTLQLPIIDKTPFHLSSHARGSEIDVWVQKHKPEKYAIIDDDGDMLEHQLPFFVQTDKAEGVSYENYAHLLKILR